MKAWIFVALLIGAPALAADPVSELATGLTTALAGKPVKFGDALNAKFHHPRCLQCHQFNSARHHGRAYNTHSARHLCDKCHSAHITGLPRGEWIAPPEHMDWTGLTAQETCQQIKQNLAGGDPVAKMRLHLLADVRVRWALDSGMTPGGRFPAVPGGYAEFAKQAQEWLAGGDGVRVRGVSVRGLGKA